MGWSFMVHADLVDANCSLLTNVLLQDALPFATLDVSF